MLPATAATCGTTSGTGTGARTATLTTAVTGTLATVHVCRLMLGDCAVGFAVFGKLEFESFKSVHVHFHLVSPPFHAYAQ